MSLSQMPTDCETFQRHNCMNEQTGKRAAKIAGKVLANLPQRGNVYLACDCEKGCTHIAGRVCTIAELKTAMGSLLTQSPSKKAKK